jgi:hypothetical protein
MRWDSIWKVNSLLTVLLKLFKNGSTMSTRINVIIVR